MPQHKPLPPREWLLENLRYEPETGLFWWVKSGTGRSLARPAGNKDYSIKSGQPLAIKIAVKSKDYKAHRLAWLMMTGKDPGSLTVDHVNRQPFDNRWSNLRLADNSLQSRNRRTWGASTCKGVSFSKRMKKWRVFAQVEGRRQYLGQFDTEEEAAAVAAPYFIP